MAPLGTAGGIESRFSAYVERLATTLGHADRGVPFRAYCTGLLLPGERKSVEPMAARVEPGRVGAAHQSLHHFVAKAAWDDAAVLAGVRDLVLPALLERGPIRAWIIDDTGMPKKGRHSVGVARQYCGQIGKQDNCQVAVSLSLATDHASLPVAFRLYLPEAWAGDAERRARAGVPDGVCFQTKPAIALDQIRTAMTAGLPPGVVLMDAGYGNDTALRDGVTALELTYVAGVESSLTVWPPGVEPLPPKPWSGRGRPPKRLRRAPGHEPVSVKALAEGLAPEMWRPVTWREGTNAPLASRFAAVRVHPAHRDEERAERRPEEWLLIEWPEDEEKPTKYWLSTLSQTTTLDALVETAKLRWRIERDYLELKQELGLGHYEGRGWRGFHHHATLCITAYGFLIRERAAIPPSGPSPSGRIETPDLPEGFRPRGSAIAP
ncbi:IS701 family transposase [Azospirillum cavernae]|uniref:IS701 family transposase n=1 Tax=Azospirillum cavernae TaxID=2320860 RepID=A0A418VQA4_9PROT|nr:IS701 family transposase [Azospirillum cavernae]RJF78443.1 IS701 family transposase [Azospirillum cavernae]